MRRAALMAALLAFGGSTVANAAEPTSAPTPRPTPAPTPPPRPATIDRNSAFILIRTSLIALQQANQTGNYSVLRGISSPDFQSANSPERLAQVFSNLRAKNFDLSGVVVLDPQLTVLPEIYSNGVMRMAGFFPSVPMQVYFELQFIPVAGQWRLVALAVDVGSATQAPPAPASTPNPALASSHSPTPAPKPAAAQSPSAAPSQPAAAKPESTESPSVEINVKPKPTPKPTPKRKV